MICTNFILNMLVLCKLWSPHSLVQKGKLHIIGTTLQNWIMIWLCNTPSPSVYCRRCTINSISIVLYCIVLYCIVITPSSATTVERQQRQGVFNLNKFDAVLTDKESKDGVWSRRLRVHVGARCCTWQSTSSQDLQCLHHRHVDINS